MLKKVIFTKHAIDRITEYGLSYKKIANNFRFARETKPPLSTRIKNSVFHSGGYKRINYKWFDGILYTISTAYGKRAIMTVTPKNKKDVSFY